MSSNFHWYVYGHFALMAVFESSLPKYGISLTSDSQKITHWSFQEVAGRNRGSLMIRTCRNFHNLKPIHQNSSLFPPLIIHVLSFNQLGIKNLLSEFKPFINQVRYSVRLQTDRDPAKKRYTYFALMDDFEPTLSR